MKNSHKTVSIVLVLFALVFNLHNGYGQYQCNVGINHVPYQFSYQGGTIEKGFASSVWDCEEGPHAGSFSKPDWVTNIQINFFAGKLRITCAKNETGSDRQATIFVEVYDDYLGVIGSLDIRINQSAELLYSWYNDLDGDGKGAGWEEINNSSTPPIGAGGYPKVRNNNDACPNEWGSRPDGCPPNGNNYNGCYFGLGLDQSLEFTSTGNFESGASTFSESFNYFSGGSSECEEPGYTFLNHGQMPNWINVDVVFTPFNSKITIDCDENLGQAREYVLSFVVGENIEPWQPMQEFNHNISNGKMVRYTVRQIGAYAWYKDVDGDDRAESRVFTHGNQSPGEGYQRAPIPIGDCNDNDPSVYREETWYLDADGDGHAISSTTSCGSPGPGYVLSVIGTNDCDDDTIYNPANHCISEHNYTYTRTYQKEHSTVPVWKFGGDDGYVQDITYYDGLGRPIQHIGIMQSPNGKDIVTHMEYDAYGRMDKEWLPYPDLDVEAVIGLYRFNTANAVEEANKHYYRDNHNDDFPGTSNVGEINPYSQKKFEASPLNRVLKQAAPGHDWRMGGGHEVEFGYHINTSSEVPYFYVDFVGGNTEQPELRKGNGTEEHYAAGELYKTVIKDENHASGTNHTTEEFTNKQGRVVLKRAYNNGAHDTYYVYNDFGNLTYVLPPKMEATTASLSELDDMMSELGYQYVYDHRNRLVEKKLPGKGWEYIVYNRLDQPIMTQDANQRDTGTDLHEWLFTKYDAFGRVAYTGKATSANTVTRQEVQGDVDALTVPWEVHTATLDASNDYGGTTVHYTNGAYPNNSTPNRLVDLNEVLTINYYDGYDATWAEMGTSITSFGIGSTANVKGLATGSKVKTLDVAGSEVWTTTATYYDEKARPIYTHTRNAYLGTVDITTTKLDFVGRPQKVRTAHTRNGTTIVTIDNFAYDHVGRLLNQTQCIGDEALGDTCNSSIADTSLVFSAPVTSSRTDIVSSSITLRPGFHVVAAPGLSYTAKIDPQFAQELIVYNNYDELGQLVRKKVGGSASSPTGLQTVNYTYNVRGWLKSINDPYNLGNDLFAFNVNYNSTDHGATPQYIQNVAEAEWKTANDNQLRWYRYGYDALYRLEDATSHNGNYDVSMSYDKMGNIQNLTRNGWQNGSPYADMDVLDYDYHNGEVSNRLYKVKDTGNNGYGFKDSSVDDQDYWYDSNGNMIRDDNKGITNIGYNHLNMPTKITVNGNGNNGVIDYVYSADGTKLQKKKTEGGVTATTDYIGNFVYEGGNLKQITHPEGYIEPDGSSWQYVYRLVDIWGNTRITYADDNNNGSIDPSSEIRREQNYYPGGLEHKGYNGSSYGVENNLKTYQAQEFTNDLGLDFHEWRYRASYPDIVRFWQVDPLAEDYMYNSTFAFQENKFGMGTELEGKELKEWWQDVKRGFNDWRHGRGRSKNSESTRLIRESINWYLAPSSSKLEHDLKTVSLAAEILPLTKSIPKSAVRKINDVIPESTIARTANKVDNVADDLGHSLISAVDDTPQTGSQFGSLGASVTDGKISLSGRSVTSGNFDFIVNESGELIVGAGHQALSGGNPVQAAGTLKVYKGQVTTITNSSGHYKPSIEAGQNFGNILSNAGVDVSGAKLKLYDPDGVLQTTTRLE